MSTSKLFHALVGNKDVVLDRVEDHESHVTFYCHIRSNLKRCSCCKSSAVSIKETKERNFRAPNIGTLRTYLRIPVHKVLCQKCGKRSWIKLPFAVGKLSMTQSFVQYILQLTAISTLLAVANLLGLWWKTVKNVDKAHLQKRPKLFSFKKLRYISIDEIAIKKGHEYMTIFTDITTGQIIHAVEGRSEEDIGPFLKQLAKKAKRLKGVGIDMSVAYTSSLKKYLPKVLIIYDRFHVTKMLNKAIDEIRQAEHRKFQKEGLSIDKGQRFLLLRNFQDLDKEEKGSLEKLFTINQRLALAHSMKEQFRSFWQQSSVKEGTRFLVTWILAAFESGILQLAKAARTLLRHSEGLLSYFEHRIDNGKAEGINNKIKVLKRNAYGYRDLEYFKLRLYHLHKKVYELVG